MANALPRPGARLQTKYEKLDGHSTGLGTWTPMDKLDSLECTKPLAVRSLLSVRITGKGGYILMCWVDLGKKRQAT